MALFNFKNKNTKEKRVSPKVAEPSSGPTPKTYLADGPSILLSPRLTEKGMARSEASVYCFNVMKDASKKEIAKAFENKYQVTPEKVRVAKVFSKGVFRKGVRGKTASGKKAYVYAPKGTKIEFV